MKTNYNIMDSKFEIVILFNKKVLFADYRLDKTTLPKNLFVYDIGHSDEDWGMPLYIQKHVAVNFYGSVITDEELDFENHNDMDLDENNFIQRGSPFIKCEEFFKN